MGIGSRLRALREGRGKILKQAAEELNISTSTLGMYEQGRRVPPADKLAMLADYYDVSVDYIVGRKSGAADVGEAAEGFTRIPIIGEVQAGMPAIAEEHVSGYVNVPDDVLSGQPGRHFYLRVKGDSMTGDDIYPGDIVLVRQQEEVQSPNDVMVVLVRGIEPEATLKHVQYRDGDVILVPDSENDAHEPQVYPAEKVRVLGKVVRFHGPIAATSEP